MCKASDSKRRRTLEVSEGNIRRPMRQEVLTYTEKTQSDSEGVEDCFSRLKSTPCRHLEQPWDREQHAGAMRRPTPLQQRSQLDEIEAEREGYRYGVIRIFEAWHANMFQCMNSPAERNSAVQGTASVTSSKY